MPETTPDAQLALHRLLDTAWGEDILRDVDTGDQGWLLNRGNVDRVLRRLQALVVAQGWIPVFLHGYFTLDELVSCAEHCGLPWHLVISAPLHDCSGMLYSPIGAPLGMKMLVYQSAAPIDHLLQ